MRLRFKVKECGTARPDEKPLHLISECIESMKTKINYDDLNKLRKVLYSHKQNMYKKPPKSRQEAMEILQQLAGDDDDLVRAADGEVAIIGRISDLQLFKEDSIQVFADGTFKYSPRHFKQMYSFFVLKNGQYIPVVHILLQDKKQKTYKKALLMLKSVCYNYDINLQNTLSKSSIMLDFEIAMLKAVKCVFKHVTIKGCKFHLGQSWWRKVKDLGLASTYSNRKSPLSKWLRGLFGLAMLPAALVPSTFKLYSSARFLRNKTNAVKQLCKYLRSNYVLETSTFVPSLWAGLDSNGKATNNGAEAFHRHFGDLFGYLRCKPSLFHFLRIISRVNTLKDIKLRSTQKTVSQRNCDKDVQLFKSKRINVKTLLSRLSMKNLPKVNKYYKRKV